MCDVDRGLARTPTNEPVPGKRRIEPGGERHGTTGVAVMRHQRCLQRWTYSPASYTFEGTPYSGAPCVAWNTQQATLSTWTCSDIAWNGFFAPDVPIPGEISANCSSPTSCPDSLCVTARTDSSQCLDDTDCMLNGVCSESASAGGLSLLCRPRRCTPTAPRQTRPLARARATSHGAARRAACCSRARSTRCRATACSPT